MTKAFIGLGSNLGDRDENLRKAIQLLKASGLELLATSSVYETEPVGPPQPDFLNAACLVETSVAPKELLALLKKIESEIGRTESERWGPREIDLDLLTFGDLMIEEPGLVVPHPEITNRAFVMVPMLEVDPDFELPSGEPLNAFCEPDPKGVRKKGPL